MADKELIALLNQQVDPSFTEQMNAQQLRERLAWLVQQLIDRDFEKLIHLLYRVDVDEARLKELLRSSEVSEAPLVIADMIIERQLKKAESRRKYRS